jgi:1-acyl-sn-glycerol-3-phosphate acyltransferase
MQEQQPPSATSGSATLSTKASKPEKNLYEPYLTPRWFWVCLSVFCRIVFFLLLNVKLKGRRNIPKDGPYIMAVNHLSWTDIPLVPCYMSRQVVYLAKEELFEGKIGWVARFLGAIPVKRGEADRQLLRASDDLLKRGKILVIYPEGTRSKTRSLNEAHAGLGMIALRAGVPVLPVAICGSEDALKKFRPRVTITFGAPLILHPKGKKVTKEDVLDATQEVMHSIAAMLPESYRGIYNAETAAPTQTENS